MDNSIKENKLALKATSEVRNAFDELSSEEGFLKSSEVILKYFASLMSPARDSEELSEDAKYVIKRLISSLASQRLRVREGCYTIFQVILQLYPQILPIAWSSIQKFYKVKEKEALADYTLGHVLALGAIIRSGQAMENMDDIIKDLLTMNDSKFTTGSIVGQFLANFLSMYKEKSISLTMWTEAKKFLNAEMKTLSVSLLWLRILIARDEYIKDIPDVPKSFQEITYHKSSYEYVVSVFKKLYTVDVNITPMLEDYFKSLVLYHPNGSDGENNISLFFSTAVTPNLDSSQPKATVFHFNISQVALSSLTCKKSAEGVLSPELMEALILSCKSDNTEVSASARGLFSAILQLMIRSKEKEGGSKVQVAVMKRLASTSLKLNIDFGTKTTVLHQATESLSAEAVIGFVKFLVFTIENVKDESNATDKFEDVLSTCQWISRLLGHPSVVSVDYRSWKAEQVCHLFKISYLSGFNPLLKRKLQDCFLKGLTHSSNKAEWQASFIEEIVEKVLQLLKLEEFSKLNDEKINLFINANKELKKLKEGTASLSSSDIVVFKILFGYGSLGIFIDSKDSVELLDEIKECYKKASIVKKKKKKKAKNSEENEETSEEPEWREVVMDLLLSLISKGESIWRKVANIIFTNICHGLKPSSFSLLTDIINPDKEDPILEEKAEDDDMEDLDTSMEVDEEETDGESEDEEDDDDDDDEDDDKDKLEIINLKKKMQKLVGIPMENVEIDSVPQDELENLDKQLGSLIGKYIALRKKQKIKKKLTKDETSLMCFRTRVCDLLETLIKEAPSLDHILQVMKPILVAINKALEDNLQIHLLGRLRSLIIEISKVRKFGKPATVSPEELATYLRDIFTMGSKLSNKLKVDIGNCCTFLVRAEQNFSVDGERSSNVVMKTYTDYLQKAFGETNLEIYDGPIHLETESLEMVLRLLLEILFKNSSRPYKKKKSANMIKDILNNEKALKKMPKEHLKEILQTMGTKIIKTFNGITKEKHIQSNYLLMLIDLLRTLKKNFKANPEMESMFLLDDVIISIQNFHHRISLTHFKVLKKAIQGLSNVNSFKLKSFEGEINDSLKEDENLVTKSEKSSKKRRKLEQDENVELENTTNLEENGMETLTLEKKRKTDTEESVEGDKTGDKKKKKKKSKRNQAERRKKNEARLWINYELEGFSFTNVNNIDEEI